MRIIERTYIQEIADPQVGQLVRMGNFSKFEDIKGLVVLGDPGIGKTQSFKIEAEKNPTSCYVSANEFNNTPEQKLKLRYQNKVIYIDGLDEVRARSKDGISALNILIKNIAVTECKKFRLSCRSLEWDNIDLQALNGLIDNQKDLMVIRLRELTDLQIEEIAGFELDNAEFFLSEAKRNDFYKLLDNPHNLKLFISIYKHGETVENRSDLFEKACKVLAKENNESHASNVANPIIISEEAILNAAGLLCATYLLTNSASLATISTAENDNTPYLLDKINDKKDAAYRAIKTRIFKQEATNQILPSHRTIAEYLAARYLVNLCRKGLPFSRVLTLITGDDNGILSDTRGLYAWITTLYSEQRQYLISRDPVGVLIYGDISTFSKYDKQYLFSELKSYSLDDPWFIRETRLNQELANLVCSDLEEDIIFVLENEIDNSWFLTFILEAIDLSSPLPALKHSLLKLANLQSLNSYLRSMAINSYNLIVPNDSVNLLHILNNIHNNNYEDDDGYIRGIILKLLYPKFININKAIKYIVAESIGPIGGEYWNFLQYFPNVIPSKDIPLLIKIIEKTNNIERRKMLKNIFSPKMFLPILKNFGVKESGKNLYDWLSNLSGDMSAFRPTNLENKNIIQFYSENEEVYFKIYDYWLENIAPLSNENNRSFFIERNVILNEFSYYPKRFGYWLLNKARLSINAEIKKFIFLKILIEGCFHKRFESPSFDDMFLIAKEFAEFDEVLQKNLVCELDKYWSEEIQRKFLKEKEVTKAKNKENEFLLKNAIDIQNGKEWPFLECVTNNYIYILNRSSKNKFDLSELKLRFSEDQCSVILKGLENFVRSENIPELKNVIYLEKNNKFSRLSKPFMFGCRSLWEKDKSWFLEQSDRSLIFALCNYFTSRDYAFDDKSWIYDLINYKPDLSVTVLNKLIGSAFLKNSLHASGLSELLSDKNFKNLTNLIVLDLLRKYDQMPIKHFTEIVTFVLLNYEWSSYKKLAISRAKSSDGERKDIWNAVLFLADPERYHIDYYNYVGLSEKRIWPLIKIIKSPNFTFSSAFKIEKILLLLSKIFKPEKSLKRKPILNGREGYIASEVISKLIDMLANNVDDASNKSLMYLRSLKDINGWKNNLSHALKNNIQKRREATFEYKKSSEILEVLHSGKPISHRDLKEFVKDHINKLISEYQGSSKNLYNKFWINKEKPHNETYCRDIIASDLEIRLKPLMIYVETEGSHKGNKSSDIKIINQNRIFPIEIKKNKNKELWTGLKQLKDQYSIDPNAKGFGLYLVLWFGVDEQCSTPKHINIHKIVSANHLEKILQSQLSNFDRNFIEIIVCDLSLPLTSIQKKNFRKEEI